MSYDVYLDNRRQAPLGVKESSQYAGQWIAWNEEGTTILASGKTMAAVRDELIKRNIDPATTVMAFIPSDETVIL